MSILTHLFVAIIAAYLSKLIYQQLLGLGIGAHHNKVVPGKCQVIPGIQCGSEQISVTSDGLAFITNGFKGLTQCNKNYLKGKIYLFNFSNSDAGAKELTIESGTIDQRTFDPHGMDIIEKESLVILFVVNHALKKESVEIFHYDRNDNLPIVKHMETIVDEKFACLNDIAAFDEESFYVTNFVANCFDRDVFQSLEYFMGLFHTSNVVYYNQGLAKVVTDNGYFLNGITLSANRKQVICAGNRDGSLFVYERFSSGELQFLKKLHIGHHPDNVFVDKQKGKYYIGISKNPLYLFLGALNATNDVSGSAIEVTPKDDKWNNVEVVEILHDDGEPFVKAISSAVHYKGQYLFGSVYDKLGHCVKT